MESHTRPLRALAEELRSFVSRPRGRLFHVWTDGHLRDSALEIAMGFEYHADNRSPFVRLDEPFAADGSCWDRRLDALRSAHETRCERMAARGYELPALPPPSTGGTSLARFGAGLAQVLEARCEPLVGLTLVVAPGAVADAGAFDRDFAQLTSASHLHGVRWILVEVGGCSLSRDTAAAMGAVHARVELDEREALADLEARLEAAEQASADASGPAQMGAAWPRDSLPPGAQGSSAKANAGTAAVASALGLPAAIFSGALREMRNNVLRGALALRRGDPTAATRHQSWAAQAALRAGLDREACLMEMVLANYLVHAEQRGLAEERYRACAQRAGEHEWFDLAAQSFLAVGSLRLLEQDHSQASVAYGWAGNAARDGEELGLAIEGFRMAGQCAARDGNTELAGRLLTEAVAIASPMPEAAAGRTSAPVAARQLAKHFETLGLAAQAQSLEEQATRMDTAARGGTA